MPQSGRGEPDRAKFSSFLNKRVHESERKKHALKRHGVVASFEEAALVCDRLDIERACEVGSETSGGLVGHFDGALKDRDGEGWGRQ
jgi:hypothetical protein